MKYIQMPANTRDADEMTRPSYIVYMVIYLPAFLGSDNEMACR